MRSFTEFRQHTGLWLTLPKPQRQGHNESPRLMPSQHAVWRSGTSSAFSAVQRGGVWLSYNGNELTVSCLPMYRRRMGAVATMGHGFIRKTG